MPINSFLYPGAKVTTGYDVDNSCRFDKAGTAYMHKSQGTPSSRRTFTYSGWIKLGLQNIYQIIFESADGSHNFQIVIQDDGNNNDLRIYDYDGSTNLDLRTSMAFRDHSAWYHVCVAIDTTQGTASNRAKLYINGAQVTAFDTATYPDQNYDTAFVANKNIQVGRQQSGSDYFDGYMAEVCFIDGSALAPTSFGEFDEDSPTIWKPINVSGLTFGTNGFYLDFEDSANLGNDANGGTDLTEVNLAATDQTTDTPTNSFAIANPILHGGTTATLSEGNCKLTIGTSWKHGIPTIGVSSGKWIMEQKIGSMGEYFAGVIDSYEINSWGASGSSYAGQKTLSIGYYSSGTKYIADSASSYGASYTTNDIIGTAIDLDAGTPTITFYKNGSSQGTENLPTSSNSTGLWFFMPSLYNGTLELNFGNPPYANSSSVADQNGFGGFEYDPGDYLALCTKNLGSDGG